MDGTQPIDVLVRDIAKKMGRKPGDVDGVVQKLHDNWIDTLYAYSKLPQDRKLALNLPAGLQVELDALEAAAELDFCWVSHSSSALTLSLGGRLRHDLGHEATVEDLLRQVGGSAVLSSEGERVAAAVSAGMALAPGARLKVGETTFKVALGAHPTATVAWLEGLGLAKYAGLFARHGLEDFFALVFLSAKALDSIGLTDVADRAALLAGVDALRKLSPVAFVGTWLTHLGCEQATIDAFAARKVDLQAIREQQFDKDEVPYEMIEAYKNFSSVEETFHWLRRHGFGKYSFHFARYNIPFYALPCVNFFIIDEMGVTHDDQMLLQALQALKQCHNFDVRAVAFWLRDLELERYNVVFARAGLLTLDALTQVTDAQTEKLVDSPADRAKLKTGIQEMQEFQFYYLATASLLQELGMERYSQLFALHGISIDVLPFLTEKQLVEMGITSKADRKKILSAIAKIKHEIPQHASVWGDAAAGATTAAAAPGKRSLKQAAPPKQIASSPNVTEERSVEELLSFISGSSGGPGSNGKKKKKNKKKNRGGGKAMPTKGANRNSIGAKASPDTVTKGSSEATSPSEEQDEELAAMAKGKEEFAGVVKEEEVVEDEEEEEGLILDPILKHQVDLEVQEFRRRLECASQSSKAKLTPIFYLDSGE